MIASLAMYDLPGLQTANDRFWSRIRARLGHGPSGLTRNRDLWEVWTSSELLLAQTCGMPYRTRLHGSVALVGTPDYGLPGCPPGYYRSVLVAHAGDDRSLAELLGGTFAFNEPLSQSGWSAPMLHFSELGLHPARVRQTGAHAASARAVAAGRADLAALDAVTWALLQENTEDTAGLREVGHTPPTPGLPLITAPTRDRIALADAVRRAISDLSPQDRARLHLRGLIDLEADMYLKIPNAPPPPETAVDV